MSIVVDSSALVAIVNAEDDAPVMAQALISSSPLMMSAATYMECAILVRRRLGPEGLAALRDTPDRSRSLDERAGRSWNECYAIYGQGSRHPVRLNFGDCFSYALAKSRNLPLLFKGDDFGHTDVRSALSAD